MIDVRLIGLVPPTPTVPQAAGIQTVAGQGAPVIPTLTPGTILAGFIVNRDAAGNPILRTQRGDVAFSTPFFLNIGSEVVLRIQHTGGQNVGHLVSVNGQPPEIAAQQSAFADVPEVIVNEPTAYHPNASVNSSEITGSGSSPKTLQAVVVASAFVQTPGLKSNSSLPILPPGTAITLSILPAETTPRIAASPILAQVTSGGGTPSNISHALQHLLPHITSLAVPASPAPGQAIDHATGSLPTTLSLGVIATAQTNAQASQAQFHEPLGHPILAQRLSSAPDGRSLWYTPLGMIETLETPDTPLGQPLLLRVTELNPPTAERLSQVHHTLPLPLAPITELATGWTSLRQIISLLNPEALGAFLPLLPSADTPISHVPSQITESSQRVLQFIAALKGESFTQWIGHERLRPLEEKGYGPLIRKAEGEFQLLAAQWNQTPAGQWQSLFFPVMVGTELQQVRSFVKREKKKNDSGTTDGEEDTRFIVEMSLSQLGAMQMDGLVRRRDAAPLQFDLVIRSHEPIPPIMQQDIQAIFRSSAEITAIRGQLAFHTVHHFPIDPLEELTPHLTQDFLV